VKDGTILAAEHNVIWQNTDATAHAEVQAIRAACRRLGSVDLSGCVLYSTAEPCSMCLTAIVWAGIGAIVYAVDMADESRYGLSEPTVACTTMLHLLKRPMPVVAGLLRDEMRQVLEDWLRIRSLEAP
jgi:tRNA(Arg) A34 adenosine deaminase TadA